MTDNFFLLLLLCVVKVAKAEEYASFTFIYNKKLMKTLIYQKINKNFTFENLSLYLTKFWFKEVYSARKAGYSKVWLTIIVHTNYNRSFVLIKNLPFNTKNYTDVIVVLKQNLYSSFFKDYRIKNIVFKFHFCDFTPLGQWNSKIKNFILFSLSIRKGLLGIISLLILIILLSLYFFDLTLLQNIEHEATTFNFTGQEVNMENITYVTSNSMGSTALAKPIACNKWSIFDPFIKLFHSDQCTVRGKCNSSCFVPNMFLPYNSSPCEIIAPDSFCLAEYIIYHEFYKVFILQDYIEGLKEFSLALATPEQGAIALSV